MSLVQILSNPGNFRFYSGRGSSSNGNAFGQKSIRFGRDRRDGASSGQPYIQVPIPDQVPPQVTDFILRNGALGTASAVLTDESRILKFFTDALSPNGTLFIAKQNLLARQNPKEFGTSRVYNPLNTLAQVALTPFGIHIKKDDTDPISAARSVIDPTTTYGYQVKNLDQAGSDRLILLANSKIYNDIAVNPFNPFSVAVSPLNILRYSGGPNSELGATNTTIRRYYSTDGFFTQLADQGNSSFLGNVNSPANISWILTSGQTRNRSDEVVSGRSFYDSFTRGYTDEVLKSANKTTTITSISPNYSTKNITNMYGDLNASSSPKNLISYTSGSGLSDIEISTTEGGFSADLLGYNRTSTGTDLVEFKIAILNYGGALVNGAPSEYKFLHFKSFLDNITDNYSAEWDSFRYLGRGEKFYTYQGFTRTINLGFTVPSFTREQMKTNYLKLGYLASAVTPNYNPQGGYMRGPLVRLTIGDYIKDQWGFIETFTYEVNGDDSTWEINIDDEGNKIPITDPRWVGELPHHIKITGFTFVPIQNFVPQTFNPNFISANSTFIGQTQTTPQPEISPELGNALANTNFASLF